MINNKSLDRTVQNRFMPVLRSCTQHHSKLSRLLHEVTTRQRSLSIAWLDLVNAYGSVNHDLIDFSLKHYHVLPQFNNIMANLYSGLSARITSNGWNTSTIPFGISVYKGDPLSAVILKHVINTLIDTLKTKSDLGIKLSKPTTHWANYSMLITLATLLTVQLSASSYIY